MRNLKLLSNQRKQFDCLLNKTDIFEFCIDSNTNKIYILFNDGTTSLIVDTANTDSGQINQYQLENFHITNASPIHLSYLSVTSEVSVIDTESVKIFDQDLNVTASYTFDCNIVAAEYSPAQDVLVTVTTDNCLQLFSVDSLGAFAQVNHVRLADCKDINQSINVGWGSKQTQFHGSEGKQAARECELDLSDRQQHDLSSSSHGVSITWRADGTLFAVNFLRGQYYGFVVLDKDGVVQCSSELCKGLEAPLSWRPAGNLIAGVQLTPANKYQIVFFEKNGLRHGQFTINSNNNNDHKQVKVKKICWSSDSEILCIIYENNRIDLWTVNNYHWYLKQSLSFNTDDTLVASWDAGFDAHNAKVLYALSNTNLFTYEWVWTINHSIGDPDDDLACVAVVDASKVLITSFKRAVVPPPFSALQLVVDGANSVNMVMFGAANSICVIDNDYSCHQYQCFDHPFRYEFKRKFVFNIEHKCPLIQNHFLWIQSNVFVSVENNCVIKHTVQDEQYQTVSEQIASCPEIIINLEYTKINPDEIFVQTSNGNIHNLNVLSKKLVQIYKIASPCIELKSTIVSNKALATLFVLDRFNRFYVNDSCLANNITSFYIHSDFLLLTTSKHYLICAPLSKIDSFKQNTISDTMFMRRIERGAKLVCAIQGDKRVILQMPRGNLEAINPRAMSIQMINNLIDCQNYLEAFKIMKVERINLNVLFDYKPEQLIENVGHFIEQIGNVHHLNMFLLELQDEDVTQSMYSMCYGNGAASVSNIITNANKKHLIADKILEYLLLNHVDNKYLLTIVTAYVVKRTQKDLECALAIIFDRKQQQKQKTSTTTTTNAADADADAALQHLLVLVPINELYNIALGMYNFELIMFVATKSQKDPKEYIPFLNELNRLDEDYKRFTIDNYLKRYSSALKSLVKCCPERFEQCLHFIRVHQLYKEALQLYNNKNKDPKEYQAICCAFGEYLFDKRCYHEAGIMFERGGNLIQALNMFKLNTGTSSNGSSGSWRQCLMMAHQIKLNVSEFNHLCRQLIEQLKVQGQFMCASTILIEYLKSYEEAIDVLTDGKLWSEALRLIYLCNRFDLIQTHVRPRVLQCCEAMITNIELTNEQFIKQKERLIVVRQQKQQNNNHQNEHVIRDGTDDAPSAAVDSDLYSDTASVVSKSSSIASKSSTSSFKSFRSSKNRRKHERKLHSLKEGSQFEEVALIRSLHQLISCMYGQRMEVHTLCCTLMQFNEDDCAHRLQNCMNSLLKLMKTSESIIWPPSLLLGGGLANNDLNLLTYGPNMTSNSVLQQALQQQQQEQLNTNILEAQYRYPPEQTSSIHWKLFTLD